MKEATELAVHHAQPGTGVGQRDISHVNHRIAELERKTAEMLRTESKLPALVHEAQLLGNLTIALVKS